MLIIPEFLRVKHRRQALKDSRLARGSSLLLLDVLTAMLVIRIWFTPDSDIDEPSPSMVPINVAADTVPFSVGATVVLGL